MKRPGAIGTGRAWILIWIAAGCVAFGWHTVWFIPPPTLAPVGPPAPAPPRLLLQSLDGSDRTLLTPIFFSFDPGRTESPDDATGLPSRSALPPFAGDLAVSFFDGPVLGAETLFRETGTGATDLADALDRSSTPEPVDSRTVRWSFEPDPPGSWSAADLREAPLPETAVPGVPDVPARIDFGPEGYSLNVSLDTDSPALREILRDRLMRWRLRPELAPGSRRLRLRPGPPPGETAP